MNSSEQLVRIYSRIMTQFKAGFSDAITIFHVEHRPDKDEQLSTFKNGELFAQKQR